MSVSASIILPNTLKSRSDYNACLHELLTAINRVTHYFKGHKAFVSNIFVEQTCQQYTFDISVLDFSPHLYSGYWDIWTGYRYCQYFRPYTDEQGRIREFLREMAFDYARIMGYHEAWVCDEFCAQQTPLVDNDSNTFEDWLVDRPFESVQPVQEYNVHKFIDRDIQDFTYNAKYHDSFTECHQLLADYQRCLPDYEILLISKIGDFLLTAQGNDIYLVNPDTGKRLTDEPIDGCLNNFSKAGFVVIKGDTSALFTNEGKQVTPFRVGEFSCEWSDTFAPFIIILDHATGNKYNEQGQLIKTRKKK